MLKIDMPVIVEGKYDKIALENVIDALIIPTDGFGIFKNSEKCDMIRRLAQINGIVILTDSDSAGKIIRNHIKNIVGNCKIINVYIPKIPGKEKRKSLPGKEGILGVEGMSPEILEDCFKRSGVFPKVTNKDQKKITKTDMYFFGLSGRENSAENRKKLLQKLSLPDDLSPNAMLDIINVILTFDEFKEACEECVRPIKS